jgi:hypothetical protein
MKHLITFAILLLYGTFSTAIYADGTSGCGAGSKLWKGESGVTAHTSANTTNNTYGNNTFSMSSDLCNCNTDSRVKASEQLQKQYITANLNTVAENMSQGKGEYLEAYSSLLGCGRQNLLKFSRITQKNYEKIFFNQYSPDSVLLRTKQILQLDPHLSMHCSKL